MPGGFMYSQENEVDRMGLALSKRLDCSVSYRNYELYGKPIFTCKCGLPFATFAIKAAMLAGDWSAIEDRHSGKTQ